MARKKWSGINMSAAQKRLRLLNGARKSGQTGKVLLAHLELARAWIPSNLLAHEPRLSRLAFPAYGYLSAFERTELFTVAYESSYRQMHARYFDLNEAHRSRPISPEYVLNFPAELTSLWLARQYADQLGIEYSFFIRQAISAVIDRWVKKRIPRPNQLLRDTQLAYVQAKWAAHCETGSHLPRDDWDPRFKAVSYRGDTAQLACLEMLKEYVTKSRTRQGQAMRLTNFLKQGWIGADVAKEYFATDVWNAAIADATGAILVSGDKAGDHSAYRAACLGLGPQKIEAACADCKFMRHCSAFWTRTNERLQEVHGAVDRRLAAKQADNRERQRRFRAKQRYQAQSQASNYGPGAMH